jgi:hypothetical protein
MGVAKVIGSNLGVTVFTEAHFYIIFSLLIFLGYLLISTLLSCIF